MTYTLNDLQTILEEIGFVDVTVNPSFLHPQLLVAIAHGTVGSIRVAIHATVGENFNERMLRLNFFRNPHRVLTQEDLLPRSVELTDTLVFGPEQYRYLKGQLLLDTTPEAIERLRINWIIEYRNAQKRLRSNNNRV